MQERRAGLQKQVSTIFTGVSPSQAAGTPQQPEPVPPHPSNDAATAKSAAESVDKPVLLTPDTTDRPTEPQQKPQLPDQPEQKPQPPEQPATKTAPVTPHLHRLGTKTPKQKWWQPICRQIQKKLLAPKPGVNPARQKAVAVLVPILFVVFVIVCIKVLRGPAGKSGNEPSLRPSNAPAATTNEIDWEIPEPYPTTLRDPMQLGSVANSEISGSIVVKGIVYSKDNPCAIIGTEIVHEGKKILGATIIKINKDSVEFEMNGKKWTQAVQR